MYGDVVGVGTGDVAQWAMWALAMSMPLLGPCGHLQGATVAVVVAGCGLVVVRSSGMMGQCLAMGGCQTLQLL